MDSINKKVGMLASKIEKVEEEVAEVKGALQEGEPHLGISDRHQLLERLGALEKEKEQLRKEMEQLREEVLRILPAPSAPAASGPTRFVVKATVRGAKNKLGIRAYLYHQAMLQTAYYRQDKEEQAIWYTGDDLHVQLCFMSMERATAFQTSLANMNIMVDVDRSVVPESYAVGTRVWSTDCDSGTFHPPVSVVERGTPLFQYQSLENPRLAECYPFFFERAHIKPKSVCIKAGDEDAVNDSNNMLALSPILHQCFDGNGAHPPAIAIRPGAQGAESFVVNGKNRTRVDVFVECRTEAIAECIFQQLKNGTTVGRNDDFRTWVHVENPTKFLQYLRWKYGDTKEKWSYEALT